MTAGKETNVNDVFNVFKEKVMTVAQEVVDYRVHKDSVKGSAWWTNEIKGAVEEKKKAYKKMLQRNVSEEVSVRRKSEYKEWKTKVKDLVDESKMRVDEEFGRKLSERFMKYRKLFWREMKKERGDVGGVSLRMRREDGMLVSSKKVVKGVWKRHFERLMNGGTGGEAIVTSMGMEAGGERVYEQRVIERVEVEKAIAKIKCGKAADIDGITPEMVKHGEDAVVEWMTMICNLAWRQGEVPDEWKMAVIVPLYKNKGNKDECSNNKGISLLNVPGKIYGRILTEIDAGDREES